MARNITKNAVERTSKALLAKVFPGLGKVSGEAAHAVFSAVVRTGSALVTDIAASMDGDATSRKGRQEKVSGWLARYDFATPVRDHLWDEVRWRTGFFPSGDAHLPVLVVSSSFNGATLYLYALNFVGPDATTDELRKAAVLAANVYFCRWGVEVLFQDVKQCFAIEDARVRTFRRLENLLAFCTLAYSYFAHVLPDCAEESRRLLKTMRDSLGEIVESFRPFVANVRELLRMERTRFISGRPRKRKPPDLTALLPGFPPRPTAQTPLSARPRSWPLPSSSQKSGIRVGHFPGHAIVTLVRPSCKNRPHFAQNARRGSDCEPVRNS